MSMTQHSATLPAAVLAVLAVALAGCTDAGEEADGSSASPSDGGFSYSSIIDDNGYWAGINARDYVELYDYRAFTVPASIHEVSDSSLQASIDATLADYSTTEEVTDRAVVVGDTVNIDYVGSIGGVEFSGGSTGGTGI